MPWVVSKPKELQYLRRTGMTTVNEELSIEKNYHFLFDNFDTKIYLNT